MIRCIIKYIIEYSNLAMIYIAIFYNQSINTLKNELVKNVNVII